MDLRLTLSRMVKGALAGCVPMGITFAMSPMHRSPYVVAYPAVILSAWFWKTPGSISAAAVAGGLIEYFVFRTHKTNLSPNGEGWLFRETMFLFGSVLAGVLTRRAALQNEAQTGLALERQLALVKVENEVLAERARGRELEKLSFVDHLTGIANRRFLMETLERESNRSTRRQEWMSLLLIDVDHFKGVNDMHGHSSGDEVLVAVARLLTKLNRGTDLPVRYGGEEFILLLPDTAQAGAVHVAERLHRELAALGLRNDSSPVERRLTVSVGIASAQMDGEIAPGGLIDAADRALYEAKRSGRNQTWVTEMSPELGWQTQRA